MKKIYLFRHGQTDWNKYKDTKYSEENHNVWLNEVGREQAKQNAIFLKDKGIQYIYTSKLKRAYETAKILADYINVGYEIVDGLEEFTIYDDSVIGLSRLEIREKIGLDLYRKLKDSKDELMDWRPFNCETKREARKRITDTIYNICKNDKHDIIAISTHGVILRQFLISCNFENYDDIKNCEVIEAEYDDNKIKIIGRIRYED